MHKMRRTLLKISARILRRKLQNSQTAELLEKSEKRAVQAFSRALNQVPAYLQLVNKSQIDRKQVTDIETFKRYVPLTDKHLIFTTPLRELISSPLSKVDYFLVSSGTSGTFSFGLKNKSELVANAFWTDLGLEVYHKAVSRKTLIINCLPMGAKLYSELPMADVGAHPQRTLALIKALKTDFDQILVIALGHLFLKRLIELGEDQGMVWQDYDAYFLTGGEGIPEAARTYVSARWAPDPRGFMPRLASSGGVTELFLNSLFYETPETILIRQAVSKNPELKKALLGKATGVPYLFNWNPLTSFIEILSEDSDSPGEVVVTNLDRSALLPLIRYNLHDIGKIISREHLCRTLQEFNLGHLTPKEQFPWLAYYGRARASISEKFRNLDLEIQEAIYADHKLAKQVTGNFKILMSPAGDQANCVFQLNVGVKKSAELEKRLTEVMLANTSVAFTVDCNEFHNFTFSMDINFENKFQYF